MEILEKIIKAFVGFLFAYLMKLLYHYLPFLKMIFIWYIEIDEPNPDKKKVGNLEYQNRCERLQFFSCMPYLRIWKPNSIKDSSAYVEMQK